MDVAGPAFIGLPGIKQLQVFTIYAMGTEEHPSNARKEQDSFNSVGDLVKRWPK